MNETDVFGFFDSQAAAYDEAYDSHGPAGYVLRTRMNAALEALGEGPGAVLDAGMGPGRLCEALLRRGWTVAGVDPSGAMVARARRRLTPTSARLVVGSLAKLPFPADAFDAVVATGVLEFATDLPHGIAEISRVVRPAGRVVVSLPNPDALYRLWRRVVFYPAVRAVKRRYRTAAPPPLPRRRPPRAARATALLARERLIVERILRVGYHVFVSPLDLLLPHAAVRASAALERERILAPVFATQVLYVARKSP